MKGGFNHPFLPLFTPSENRERNRIHWHLEITMILLVIGLNAFGPFCLALVSKMTMDRDPAFISIGAFGVSK
jgi:hypothetical protein